MVTGPVTRNMREGLERTWRATPDPKWVVAVGDCAAGCGVFAGSPPASVPSRKWCRSTGDPRLPADADAVAAGTAGAAQRSLNKTPPFALLSRELSRISTSTASAVTPKWSHIKRTGVARAPLRRGEKLPDLIEAQLASIKRMPQLVRSFFQAPTVAYISDCE